MKKYGLLTAKRLLRMLPFVLCVAAILFGALATVFTTVKQMDADNKLNVKFKLGMVGTADDLYLEMGLAALNSMDSSRFSFDMLAMSEEEAKEALQRRDIAAYIVFPDGFMDSALSGNIPPLKFVCTTGAVDIVTLIKDEVTKVVEDILLYAQKGTYGVGDALYGNGQGSLAGKHVGYLAIEYVEFILDRGKIYVAEELGVSDGLDLQGYLISGLSVLFLLLVCMPFAPMMIRSERTMEQLLSSRQIGFGKQLLVEFFLYFLSIFLIVGTVVALLLPSGILSPYDLGLFSVFQALPVVLLISAWSFLLFEISRDMISGVLLQFFSAVCLSFISGCLYPTYFFPDAIQRFSNYLPTGAARVQLARCLTGEDATQSTWLLLLYTAGFLGLTLIVRYRGIHSDRR